ncbi:hypothetical protein [Natrarchaeobius chitinivorans]|uniref:Uncharacterized protein n=1 Tax=Natrarchaeobius chitinivorans TaxID=1679083 RepID=A0A3N6P2R8_NATCH|nr:hypothetical protein [Natrarchaeobius chitinivorans]RQG89495.1 hypothetical protein EA473_21945 [Natrarchaeobius chitinivorans]
MIVAATGFAIVFGGRGGAFVHAEATGVEETLLRIAIGVVFFVVLAGSWYVFTSIDREST